MVQNTTAIILNVLIVVGPLVGVYLGYYLSRRDEKSKRKKDAFEELYYLCLKIDKVVTFGMVNQTTALDISGEGETLDHIYRMRLLARLYYQSFEIEIDKLLDILTNIHNAQVLKQLPDKKNSDAVRQIFVEAQHEYRDHFLHSMQMLEKMIKKS